ncbi:N-acetylmuramic acid 6-phosphate etherase [Aestuariibius sp. 2305UL40-4]|uniref:N-acetylmuramic acid 6-phosphate etherase n=1 Tax=Aestuariibius violaceus TaxID=3234132 RepID=UPI00345E0CBB
MTTPQTEALHDTAKGLDADAPVDIASVLVEGQIAAATAVRAATAQIAVAAAAMARSISNGGTLHYVAAGSSGLMAAADAQELGGTFSIPATQLRIHMAGGLPTGVEMSGDTEDDVEGLEAALAGVTNRDTLITVSASGTTPYTLAAARRGKAYGATIVAIANNPGTPLLTVADHPVCLTTPPEVLSGSTRMGAGTAQKIALNMLSTLMAVRLGHVHDGMMVNLRADNMKLRARALSIVCQIARVEQSVAAAALDAAQNEVKPAILIAAKAVSQDRASEMLRQTGGNLRAALAQHA